jgi:hypothetical protein
MSLFTLGLLRGASQQYVRTKEAEAAAEAREKELRDEREFQEKMEANRQTEARFLAGRQQYFQERLAEKQDMWATARSEQNFNQQVILAEETQRIQQEANDVAKEKAIVDTFGYIALDGPSAGKFVGGDYTGQKRLPDATELGPELQRRVQKGIPTILPNILGTIPGFDNIIKSTRNSAVSVDPFSDGMYGASEDFNNGYITVPTADANGDPTEQIVRLPSVDPSKGDLKGRARANTKLVMKAVTETPDFIEQMIGEYNRGEFDNYNTVRDAIALNAGDALRESMKIAKTEGGDIVINNPVDFYGLLTNIKGKANQRWFAEKVLRPALSLSVDTIKTLMGDPAEISYTYDEVNNRIIRPDESKWKWATVLDEDTGKTVIKQDIWKQTQEISKYNGLPAQTILGLVKNHKNPLRALKDMAETRTQLKNGVYSSGGVVQVTEETKSLVQRKLEENNFDSVSDEILYVRSLVEDSPASRPTSVAISASGDIAPKYANRKKLYSVNGEDAAKMAAASRRAQVISGRLLELRERGLGGVGLMATLTRLAGGGRDIAEAMLTLSQSYNMEPSTAARFAENAQELQKYANIDTITVESIEGQKLFDLLGEQLAFAMAAAVQGGEGGRAISDRDVESQRAVLGLKGILASNTGIESNLRYINEQMALSAAINGQYAKAIDSEDFKAVYIYDQSVERSRTLDALLAGAPARQETAPNVVDDPDSYVIINGRKVAKAK